MNFIAGYIAGLSEEAPPPAVKPLTVTQNGVYSAENETERTDGYSPVTVNVPTGITDKIISLPAIGGGAFGCSYHFLFHKGNVTGARVCSCGDFTQPDNETKVTYIARYQEPLQLWFVLYRNEKNKVVFAMEISQGTRTAAGTPLYDHYESYSTKFIDPDNPGEGYEPYLNERKEFLGGGINASFSREYTDTVQINAVFDYTYRATSFSENGSVNSAADNTASSTFTIQLPETYIQAGGTFSDLTADEWKQEMIAIKKEADEIKTN